MIEISKIYSLIRNLLQSLEKEIAEVDNDKNSEIHIKDKIFIKKNMAQTLSKIVSVISTLEKIDNGYLGEEISEDDMYIINNFYENFYDKN
jgi:hypothetical protein